MIKVLVKEQKDTYNYILEDSNNNLYKINIDIKGIILKEKDIMYLNEEIIKIPNIYTFEIMNENTYQNIKEKDIIKLISNNQEYYLKRLYG